MKITIIAVGKLKERYLKEAVAEYAKRMSRYASFDIIEVADEKAPETLSPAQAEIVRQKEAERILSQIKPGAFVIATAIEGKALSSEELSQMVQTQTVKGASHICFIIGGSVGLGKEVLTRADFLWSFSRLTFPHQLMRVMLSEQIYRAFKIMGGEPYHK